MNNKFTSITQTMTDSKLQCLSSCVRVQYNTNFHKKVFVQNIRLGFGLVITTNESYNQKKNSDFCVLPENELRVGLHFFLRVQYEKSQKIVSKEKFTFRNV